MHFAEPMFENAGKPDQNRQRNASPLQRVHQFLQVYEATLLFGGVDKQISVLAHGEIALSPARDIIKFRGFRRRPAVCGFANLCESNFCVQG
jgi:hypothetical protein